MNNSSYNIIRTDQKLKKRLYTLLIQSYYDVPICVITKEEIIGLVGPPLLISNAMNAVGLISSKHTMKQPVSPKHI